MDPVTLNTLLMTNPFVPLRLTLTTGETIDISDPNAVFITTLGVHIYGLKRAGERLVDWDRIVSLRHIVKVEKQEPSTV
ncbi:MAG: hypothetical protein FWD53_09300 [Phycisphaerales bacterium]|nr:hypothetical protein [Phycisphaerales bacterium]